MKLLIINQKVDENDSVLGIYVPWINEFGRQCDKVFVITQFEKKSTVAGNVSVVSLGKERGFSKIKQIFRFYKFLWTTLPKVDAVLVHMIPEWVILGFPLFVLRAKKVSLFYAHKHVDLKLRIASLICSNVLSSVPGSNLLKTKKLRFVGQGIPKTAFKFKDGDRGLPNKLKIISVGRLTPRKDYLTIVRACEVLEKKGVDFEFSIVGPSLNNIEKDYENAVKKEIKKLGLDSKIKLTGAVPNKRMVKEYHKADVMVNAASRTGADKVVFESCLTGCLPLTCDPALANLLNDQRLLFSAGDSGSLAELLLRLYRMDNSERAKIRIKLRQIVEKEHTADVQVSRIIKVLSGNN